MSADREINTMTPDAAKMLGVINIWQPLSTSDRKVTVNVAGKKKKEKRVRTKMLLFSAVRWEGSTSC